MGGQCGWVGGGWWVGVCREGWGGGGAGPPPPPPLTNHALTHAFTPCHTHALAAQVAEALHPLMGMDLLARSRPLRLRNGEYKDYDVFQIGLAPRW